MTALADYLQSSHLRKTSLFALTSAVRAASDGVSGMLMITLPNTPNGRPEISFIVAHDVAKP